MKTFKNTAAASNKDVTTIWFAQADEAPTEFGKWEECDELEIDFAGAVHVFRQGGTDYFGRV